MAQHQLSAWSWLRNDWTPHVCIVLFHRCTFTSRRQSADWSSSLSFQSNLRFKITFCSCGWSNLKGSLLDCKSYWVKAAPCYHSPLPGKNITLHCDAHRQLTFLHCSLLPFYHSPWPGFIIIPFPPPTSYLGFSSLLHLLVYLIFLPCTPMASFPHRMCHGSGVEFLPPLQTFFHWVCNTLYSHLCTHCKVHSHYSHKLYICFGYIRQSLKFTLLPPLSTQSFLLLCN